MLARAHTLSRAACVRRAQAPFWQLALSLRRVSDCPETATARFDNADKGNRLHVMVCIMTHDREPPPGFPWADGEDLALLE